MISLEELEVALEAAPDRWRLAILLASWCQLRRSEVLGLQRGDFDLLHRRVSIRRGWTVGADARMRLDAPKSEAGRRTLEIPANVLPTLEHHLSGFVGPLAESWIFEGVGGGPAAPRSLDHVWTKARRAAGRADVRFHDLRHSGLTWVAMHGATAAELMRRGGHSTEAAAMRYQQATAERDRLLADALAAFSAGSVVELSRTVDGHGGAKASDIEQSQRDSNPCLHLERVMS